MSKLAHSPETLRFAENWSIRFSPKPGPDHRWDWDFWHDDYDGAEDGADNRAGSAESVEACKTEIRLLEDDADNCCTDCGAVVNDDGFSVDEACCFYCSAD